MEEKTEKKDVREVSDDALDDVAGIHREWSLIVNRWIRVIHEIFMKWKIPVPSIKVMLFLRIFQNDAEPSVIADFITVPRQTMTSILDGMEVDGLIVREAHPSDRRKKLIYLSQAGRVLADRVLKEIRYYETQAMQVLTDRELKIMLRTMRKFSTAMERCVAEGRERPEAVESTTREEKI